MLAALGRVVAVVAIGIGARIEVLAVLAGDRYRRQWQQLPQRGPAPASAWTLAAPWVTGSPRRGPLLLWDTDRRPPPCSSTVARDPVSDRRRGSRPELPAGPRPDHALPGARRTVRPGGLGVGEGREVPGDYDSMFAKLIVSLRIASQRGAGCSRALDEYIVEGVPTTIPVQRWILDSKEFRSATHTTTWLERALTDADLPAQVELQPEHRRGTGPTRRHPRRGGRSPRARPHLRRTARCRPEGAGSPRGS